MLSRNTKWYGNVILLRRNSERSTYSKTPTDVLSVLSQWLAVKPCHLVTCEGHPKTKPANLITGPINRNITYCQMMKSSARLLKSGGDCFPRRTVKKSILLLRTIRLAETHHSLLAVGAGSIGKHEGSNQAIYIGRIAIRWENLHTDSTHLTTRNGTNNQDGALANSNRSWQPFHSR
jgi:hypothetical protein